METTQRKQVGRARLPRAFRRATVTQVQKVAWSLFRAVLIIGMSYIILFPLLTKIPASLMSERDLFDRTVNLIPRKVTLDNYRLVFQRMDYPVSFLNSFGLACGLSLLHLVSCSLVGYGFARFKFRGRGLLFALVVFTLIVPPQVLMVPLYLNFRYFRLLGILREPGINMLGSAWPFVVMAATATGLRNGLYVYIMRQYFSGVPKSLEEAAYIDGASTFKTFYSVMLPNALPVMVVVFLFSFVWQWNDSFFTSIFVGNNALLPMRLEALVDRAYGLMEITGPYASLVMNTGILMFVAPLLILYAFLQRYFVESVERTGIVD